MEIELYKNNTHTKINVNILMQILSQTFKEFTERK